MAAAPHSMLGAQTAAYTAGHGWRHDLRTPGRSVAYSPLHAGLLAGALEVVTDGRASSELQQRVAANHEQLEAYERLCRDLDTKPEHVALAWLLGKPAVSTAVVGASSVEQPRSNLGGLSVTLDPQVLRQLEDIWPGPGEAPQAYAW